VRELAEEICAFANSSGGYLIIGINDKNQIIGVEIDNKKRSAIQDAVGNISPSIHAKTYPVEVDGKTVWVIDVPSGQRKPYLLSGSIYIREGANTQKLTNIEEVRASFQQANSIFFDDVPCRKFDPEHDTDTEFIRDFKSMAGFQRDIPNEHLFTNLKLFTDDGNFKNGAVLFFGRQPEDFLDNAFVRCVAFDGIDKRYIADDKKMYGNLYNQYTQALRWLKQNLRVRYQIEGQGGGPRKEIWEIPEDVLKEALINAIVHRDYYDKGARTMVELYNDRVVITNPGGLISSIPPEKFGTMSRTRNPLIFGLFERIRLVEYVGSGVMRMRASMKDQQLPAPDFWLEGMFNITIKRPETENDTQTHESFPVMEEKELTVRNEKTGMTSEKMSAVGNIKHADKILELIDVNPKITAIEMAKEMELTERQLRRILTQLVNINIIERSGSDKVGEWHILMTN
jgi:ATP-dependent DNA helicase RecG